MNESKYCRYGGVATSHSKNGSWVWCASWKGPSSPPSMGLLYAAVLKYSGKPLKDGRATSKQKEIVCWNCSSARLLLSAVAWNLPSSYVIRCVVTRCLISRWSRVSSTPVFSDRDCGLIPESPASFRCWNRRTLTAIRRIADRAGYCACVRAC